MDVRGFTGTIIGVVIAIVVTVSVLVPIITDNVLTESSGLSNWSQINTLIEILPLLVILSIVVIVVGSFISKRV